MSVQTESLIRIPSQSGTAFRLGCGALLRVVDPCGGQVADLVAFAASDTREAISNGRTFDYNETIRLTAGNRLYSNRSRVMLTIVRDEVGIHDFLLAPCSRDTWRECYADPADERPGCFGNLASALAPYGIAHDAIPTAFNVFMNVALTEAGRLAVLPPISTAGAFVELRAEMDLIVGLTACSAPLSNGGALKPIEYSVA